MLTEWTIALTLMRERHRRNFVLPNYTPRKWWECDVFELTDAGYFREYEVKLTISDFKADAKKQDTLWSHGERVTRNKHQLMGQPIGPRQFWYVAPEGLLTPDQVPEWAGLITIHDARPRHSLYWRYAEQLEKRAPVLHQQVCDPKIKAHAESVCYYRLHNEWTGGRLSEMLEQGAGI